MSKIQNSLSLLDHRFKPLVEKWLKLVAEKGLNVRVIETLRTPERQVELQASGASQLKKGYHQLGLAFDFACYFGNGVYQTSNLSGDYTIAGELGESLGMVWGGRWVHLKDFGHLEWHPPSDEALVT